MRRVEGADVIIDASFQKAHSCVIELAENELSRPVSASPGPPKAGPELILATKRFARDSSAKSWWCILSSASLLALALAGTLADFHLLGRLLFSILSGLLILRVFVIYHDQQHHAILPKSRLAEIFMRLFGIYALSASSIWRSSHNHHHNHNSKLRGSHIGSFPIMTKTQFLRSPKRKQIEYLFVRHPLTILFGYVFMFLFGMCLNPFLNNFRKHWDCLAALLIHVAIGVLLVTFADWQTLILAQTIPHFIAYAIGTYLFYAQHNFPDVSFSEKAGWTYEKAALESSSYMRTNRMMAWFTANIGYHHVHHLNARIPFYRLPEAHRSMPELSHPKITSLNPIDIYRCLRLKVWDSEAQRMIGFRELSETTKARQKTAFQI
ncbi:MAG TPA: fatty acid desaturase [Verrucomicrobiae bacterium]|nr:fatty acid desaturase [Verrucomicrobiae bacterium]